MAASASNGGRNIAKVTEMLGEYLRTCKGLDSLLKHGRLVSVESGRVVYEAEVREEHTNRGGTMHGGFAALLVDSWTSVAIMTKAQPKDEIPLYSGVSVALSVNFLRAAKKNETIVVSAAVDRVGRTLAFTSCEIRSKAIVLPLSTVISVHGQYAQPPKKAKGCGLPIMVNTVYNPDTSLLAGTWYKYGQSGIASTNQVSFMTALNRTALPFSMVPAMGIVAQFRQYNDNTSNCVNRFFIGLCGSNGQYSGKQLTSLDNYNVPTTQDFSLLYMDTAVVHFLSQCLKPNYKSGMCEKPEFQVLTRVRPDKMTPEQAQALEDIIDNVLAPYCLSSADINKQQYKDDKSFCPLIEPKDYPPCVKSIVTALENQISNSIGN